MFRSIDNDYRTRRQVSLDNQRIVVHVFEFRRCLLGKVTMKTMKRAHLFKINEDTWSLGLLILNECSGKKTQIVLQLTI